LAGLLRTTRSINVVFVLVSDPVAQGFVTNLAHPSGNITGFSAFEPSLAGKWLDLLKQASPGSGLIFHRNQFLTSQRSLILDLVARYRLPAIYASETFARNGGLIYYGTDWQNQFRQAAIWLTDADTL
jgi:hypothetical protein